MSKRTSRTTVLNIHTVKACRVHGVGTSSELGVDDWGTTTKVHEKIEENIQPRVKNWCSRHNVRKIHELKQLCSSMHGLWIIRRVHIFERKSKIWFHLYSNCFNKFYSPGNKAFRPRPFHAEQELITDSGDI
jgi:hypothetical protein